MAKRYKRNSAKAGSDVWELANRMIFLSFKTHEDLFLKGKGDYREWKIYHLQGPGSKSIKKVAKQFLAQLVREVRKEIDERSLAGH